LDVREDNRLGGHFGQLDNLQYQYSSNSNQLKLVEESANVSKGYIKRNNSQYEYDVNGNLTADPQKEIVAIQYNYLNLPERIQFTRNRVIEFLYDAAGQKLRKTVREGEYPNGKYSETVKDYIGGVEYTNTKLERVPHAEGYISRDEQKGD
jgi:hypothetical protein